MADNGINIEVLIAENQRLKQENRLLQVRQQALSTPSSNIFKLALSRVSEAICMAKMDGRVVYTNEEFRRVYGITSDTYNGMLYDLNVSIGSEAAFKSLIQKIQANGGNYVYQARLANVVDNQRIYHQVSAFLMNTDQGEMVGLFLQDITAYVKNRDELRELNMLMDTILNNLPVYLFVKDVEDDLRYVYWNKAFAEYSKIPASRVIGNTDFEVFPNYEDALKFRKDDMELVNTHEPISRHESYGAADGKTRIVQTTKVLCPREGKGPLLIGVSIDITNMQNIEQELVQERIRAEQSDRLKSTFLANMSHEIRTPLNAIVGFSNLLTQVDDEEQKRQFAEIINQNSESLLQLINDILDISKIEAGTIEYVREPMELGEMFQNIYELQKRREPPTVKLVLDLDKRFPKIVINEDRNRINQVVNNLINNAWKFTQKGEIRFGYRVYNDHIKVFVKDTGIGIAPDKVDKVFDRFVKLNTFAPGTGLGLSICKLIVNLLGGEIAVESKPDIGSIFAFTIPYVLDRDNQKVLEEDSHKIVEMLDSHQSGTESVILVAEDNQSNFLLLKTLLGKRYKLLWAKNGSEAVELYKDNNPDLIFMDIKMPGMDGIEATRYIRSMSKDVPIVALTAYAYQSDRQKAHDAGMNDYLTKPLSTKALEEVLHKYL